MKTENKKRKPYIAPNTRWVWIGLNEGVAGNVVVTNGSIKVAQDDYFVKGESSDLNPWGNEESELPKTKNLWDEEW